MASNPMQKKSRNSFLLGMLLMLIIAAIVMVFIIMMLTRNNKKQQAVEQQTAQNNVYVVKNAIASGQELTENDLKITLVNAEAVPQDAFGQANSIDLYKEIVNQEGEYDSVPKYRAKIDLIPGTVLSERMLYEGEELNSSARIVEYNMLQLPVQLEAGEYVDIRFKISNGQDYIVVSHKEVKDVSLSTIWLQLNEEEILLMSNAIVEAYISPATNLYVTKYVEPGMQESASITYVPSTEVINLINSNGNVVNTAKTELVNRYYTYNAFRDNIVTEINKYSEDGLDNIESGMNKSREDAITAREEFLYGID